MVTFAAARVAVLRIVPLQEKKKDTALCLRHPGRAIESRETGLLSLLRTRYDRSTIKNGAESAIDTGDSLC